MRCPAIRWQTYGIALSVLSAAAALAQDATPRKVRQKMSDSIGSTQDFICSVSIERSSRMGGAAPTPLPSIKAQTGVLNGREVYAWPSNDADVATLKDVMDQYGRVSAGNFALYTRPLFLTNAATFYAGPVETKDGRQVQRWDFTVPKESSRYTIAVGGKPVVIGYSGTFWSEVESGDLVRLELRPDNVPDEAGIKGFTQALEYGRSKIGGISIILPTSSELVVLESSGRELRTKARLENCRTFTSQAGIQFIEGVKEALPPPVAEGPILPAKLDLETQLLEAIDERTSPPGTPITLKLTKDLKSEGKVLVPKGATITGKVTRVSRQSYKVMDQWKGYYIVGLQLDTIEGGGQKYHVHANLQTVGPTTILTCFLPFSEAPDKWGLFIDVRDELTFPKPAPGESIVGVVREYLRVPKGLRLVWSTVPAGS